MPRNRNIIFRTITHPTFYQWNSGIALAAIVFLLIRLWDVHAASAMPAYLPALFVVNIFATTISSTMLASGRWSFEKFMRYGPIIGMYPFCIVLGILAAFVPGYLGVVVLFLAASPFILMEFLDRLFVLFYLTSFVAAFLGTAFWFNPSSLIDYRLPLIFSGTMLVVYMLWLLVQSSYLQSKDRQIKSLLRGSRKHRREIEVERSKSDALLKNILPDEIAKELRENRITEPRYYSSASILFTDFHGFTQIAEKLSPQELIEELDKCFSYFDGLMDRNGLEKLKTIGDSYMCAGGIPLANQTHAVDCVLAAMEIRSIMHKMKEIKEQQNLPYWELRIGIHSGPVVAGVIGEKKFSYDVWGDTVNTASRMESGGATGKINVSAVTHELIAEFFSCESRGKISVKNKGEVEMYFVNAIHPALSLSGAGQVPNAAFRQLYDKLKQQS